MDDPLPPNSTTIGEDARNADRVYYFVPQPSHPHVAIVGATGAVGQEFLNLFESRMTPIGKLSLLASARSAGSLIKFRDEKLKVEEVSTSSFNGVDLAFFSAGATRSRAFAPVAVAAGALVIDNSSAFRMDSAVPLVVPEVNLWDVHEGNRIISVPNCSAIILLMAVNPLRKLGTLDRLIISTYQSASGGGASMMRRLEEETAHHIAGTSHPVANSGYPPYAFNLFSHNTPIDENGANEEETKMIQETRKILGMPNLRMNVTCVRVPVLRAHSESVTVEFAEDAPSLEAIREVLSASPGVRVIDDRAQNSFPTPALASGQGDVLVGRIRHDPSNPRAVSLFIAGDQLLKGAALNALQIAEAVYFGQPVG